MFFVGIFGISSKEKEVKKISIQCRNCSSDSKGDLIKQYSFFHIFFIPVIKWAEKYFVKCNGCRSLYTIPKDVGEKAEKNELQEISYWHLNEISNSGSNMRVICSVCGEKYNEEYNFCPNCGEKRK